MKMRKTIRVFGLAFVLCMMAVSCKENYSIGEKVGTLTEFAQSGLFWDSWDGRLPADREQHGFYKHAVPVYPDRSRRDSNADMRRSPLRKKRI